MVAINSHESSGDESLRQDLLESKPSDSRASDDQSRAPAGLAIVGAFCAGLGAFIYGYSLAYSSPSLTPMEVSSNQRVFTGVDVDKTGGTVTISSDQAALFSSIMTIGAMLGALLSAPLNNRLGRKASLLAISVPLVCVWAWLGSVPQPESFNDDGGSENNDSAFSQLITIRFLNGVLNGVASATVPMYISEIAPVHMRGSLTAINQFMVTFGILAVNLMGKLSEVHQNTNQECADDDAFWKDQDVDSCDDISASWDCNVSDGVCRGPFARWRFLALAAAVLSGLLFVCMLPMPESPVYLCAIGARDRARAVLRRLRGGHEQIVEAELAELSKPLAQQSDQGPGLVAAIQQASRPILIGVALMILQQFSGINSVIFYSGQILQLSGMTDPNLGSVIVMAVQFAATGVSVLLMDKAGRRMLMVVSCVGMAIFGVGMAIFFFNGKHPSFLALLSLIGYILSFSLGMGPIPWLIVPELNTAEVRSVAVTIATLVNWSFAFVVTELFSIVVVAITAQGVFLFYAAVCAAAAIFSMTIMPETKGKTIEEIQRDIYKYRALPTASADFA